MNLRRLMLVLVLATPVFGQKLPPTTPQPTEEEKKELEASLADLGRQIEALRREAKKYALLPDVEIYHKAVRFALTYGEMCETSRARKALQIGLERAELLRKEESPWVNEGGVRAYVSKIDQSIQPYILAVPKGFNSKTQKFRLDIFCHGRDEKLTDLNFITGKIPPAPENRFVIYPYGRYCVANKFAGEIDLFEALDSVKWRYPIDEDRIVLTGFSMGGAAVWHLATHYPDRWVAASPGAGFAETRQYQHIDINGPDAPPWYEQRLWNLYDATAYARNLFTVPLIAYHGELDKQRQSSDVMEAAMKQEGLKLERIIGPGVGHKYEEKAKAELDRRLDELAQKGRNRLPREVHFTTWTLRYDSCYWVRIDRMAEHWKPARVDARLLDNGDIDLKTQNVNTLTLSFHADATPYIAGSRPMLTIDGQKMTTPFADKGGAWDMTLLKGASRWVFIQYFNISKHGEKMHGTTGPIDDAFMGPFVFVEPTGKPMNEKVGAWASSEMQAAEDRWRRLFRGEVKVFKDNDPELEQNLMHNFILWGDPSSNKYLARIMDELPVRWDAKEIKVGGRRFDSADHALVMIYPKPKGRGYIVIDSGHTFRDDHDRTNSQQTPKLPDWAVIDLNTPPSGTSPGKVVAAGFFDENWQLSKDAPHE